MEQRHVELNCIHVTSLQCEEEGEEEVVANVYCIIFVPTHDH